MTSATEQSRPDPIQQAIDAGRITFRQIVVIALCMALNMSDGYDVLTMAYTANGVQGDLGLTPDQLGLIFSSALAGMMLGAMFLAPLADRFGRRNITLISVLVIGTSMSVTGLMSSLLPLMLLRFIAGLGVGAILASLAAMASEFSPTRFKSFAVVIITVGYPFGAMLAAFVAEALIPAYGWQSMFFFGGAVNFVLALLVWLLLPESMHYLQARGNPDALARINAIMASIRRPPLAELPPLEAEHTSHRSLGAQMLSLLAPGLRARTLVLWSAFFFCFICLYFLLSWIPKMLIDSGFSEIQGVQGGKMFNLGAILGVLLVGIISTRSMLSSIIGFFLVSSGFLMIAFAFAPPNITLLLTVIFVIGILQQGGFTGLYAVAAKVYPTRVKATGIGWAIGLGRFGAVVGPYMAGVFIANGISMETNFILFAVPMIVGGALAWSLRVR